MEGFDLASERLIRGAEYGSEDIVKLIVVETTWGSNGVSNVFGRMKMLTQNE